MSTTTLAAADPPVSEPCQGRLSRLVLRCGQGDEAALGDLFDLTYFLVASIVTPGGISSTGTDQAVLEAFWRIWRRSPGYAPTEAGVLHWVFDQVHDRPASPAGHAPHSISATG
jgi:hypothetical protein